ncbi:unnamed protein product [Sphagnum troendelagicum]|uniref:Uncharacterized protein n=1 Tax=Sphagnum troendelagicum TaxID=128251 RepID=A0ABP0UKZ8_9BRYO
MGYKHGAWTPSSNSCALCRLAHHSSCINWPWEVLASIGRLEFFYEQAPDSMRSLGAAFLAATSGLGAYLGSFLVAATMKLTGRNGRRSWISNTISSGHIDYYFWLVAVLSVINLMAFLYFASIYKHKVDTVSIMQGSLAKPLTSNQSSETYNLTIEG